MNEKLPAADRPEPADLTNFNRMLRKWFTRAGEINFGPELTPESLEALQHEAQQELDAAWPYLYHDCVFGGEGAMTPLGSETDGADYEEHSGEGVSHGLSLEFVGPDYDRRWRIVYVLIQDNSEPGSADNQDIARYWLDAKTSTVTSLEDLEQLFAR